CNLVEGEDHVEVNGEIFQKPFVEKPVSAEDHNVYIYYPTSAGGGSQRLFRKIGSRSSVYSPESNVRKTGSYIYEEFMPTDGTDVKVYTVGPDYAHAEARKSPALDGKVERDSEGKEVRYPVILNAREKLIAWKVCSAFKQTVCGFDLLRANGQSYVCDVNGFSFVKNSMKYYDDCAKIMGNIIMRELAPQFQIPWSIPLEAEDIPIVPTTSGTMMELRCVIAVIRHGDRTPKQKMKMEVRHQRFFDLFEKCEGYKSGKLKLKKPKQLQEVLDIARQLLVELVQNNDSEIEESKAKLEQLKTVLEMYGHFSGINRKVQLTYLPHGCPKTSSEEEGDYAGFPGCGLLRLHSTYRHDLKIYASDEGRVQMTAAAFAKVARPPLFSPLDCDYAGFPGCGLLRLHSTYRHDLKIYASDEGRVQMTAAAFAKDPSSEDRFHVELHFSPGAKGCEEDKNLPSGFGYRPASRENEGSKKKSHNDSDEEAGGAKRDEPDRALMMFRPMVSDPIYIHRKSPLPRSKKIGSVEEESPLSVSSPDSIGTWIHYTCGVGTGRRRRRSGDQITSSPVSPKSLAFTSSIFGSWQQVLSENNSHSRPSRLHPDLKLTPGIGSHCAGLFSTMVLGGSSSAPNLQDYAHAHRKKLTSSGFLDEATRGSAVKRFSISFARHPTNVFSSMFSGFELYSMVPSICPLETLHNSLSLKQVDDFLASIAISHDPILEISASSPAVPSKKTPLNTYTPAKVLPCPFTQSLGKKTCSPEKSASDQVDFPARKPRGVSEHGASSGKTSQPSSETKQPKPAPNISILLPPESHDSAVKTQQQSSGTATHETPALENKSATKTVSGFYT
ncbi:inositol hexakisphosphate and diphosphoinositol-pentakisphosphate kinase 2-like, partial [Sinocyclocheilus grahami]|uniref:inositol hexakisphosphate and diphosphoinositol-pentakisphosphate kinase 2-like n=1 Tax=Sinocyclocheilus grahami TaxID=75366 RepID=UPI0007ACBCEA